MKVLLALEDSPCSEAALAFLLKMTWPSGTRVIVLSVSPQPVAFYGEAYGAWIEYDRKYSEEGLVYHRKLAEAAAARLTGAGLIAEAQAVNGDARIEILGVAEREKADIIVVGSHGRTGLSKFVLGSVASHVTTHAHANVLVVKQVGARGEAMA